MRERGTLFPGGTSSSYNRQGGEAEAEAWEGGGRRRSTGYGARSCAFEVPCPLRSGRVPRPPATATGGGGQRKQIVPPRPEDCHRQPGQAPSGLLLLSRFLLPHQGTPIDPLPLPRGGLIPPQQRRSLHELGSRQELQFKEEVEDHGMFSGPRQVRERYGASPTQTSPWLWLNKRYGLIYHVYFS